MSHLAKQVAEHIHASGGRMTIQRQIIVDAIEEMEGHPTAEDIYECVREQDPTINLSTVYRMLNWLEEQGLINARWFDEKRHKHRFDPADTGDHYHFCCQVCQVIVEFPEPMVETIKTAFEAQTGAQINNASLVLTGVCANCLPTKE